MSNSKEVAHYVVTAHPPGSVRLTAKCNFLSENSLDVLVAKSRRLEVRQLRSPDKGSKADGGAPAAAASTGGGAGAVQTPFPVVLTVPINGRLTSLCPFKTPASTTSYVFFTTDQYRYGVISYDPAAATAAGGSPYPIRTHASGSLLSSGDGGGGDGGDFGSGGGEASSWPSLGGQMLGRPVDSGHIVAMDPYYRCIALHMYDGLVTIIPINAGYVAPPPLRQARYKDDGGGGGGGEGGATTMAMDGGGRHHHHQIGRPSGQQQLLGQVFHCRIEERVVLAMSFLYTDEAEQQGDVASALPAGGGSGGGSMPQLCILHQDSRGAQHMISHLVNVGKQQLHLFGSHSAPASTRWLKKSSVDGGSALLIPVPTRWEAPAVAAAASAAAAGGGSGGDEQQQQSTSRPQLGGVVILGQRQFTYCSPTVTKILPVPQALFLSYESLPADPATGMPRYLLGDEFGNLHMLSLLKLRDVVFSVQLETLGSCALSSSLAYLGEGLVYVGSHLGDSQLVQIHDEPIAEKDMIDDDHPHHDVSDLVDTTYLTVVEEYTHLGPILDFDLVPTTPGAATSSNVQSQVVTASGSSKSGSIRLIRNGIGMNEYASVEIPGIQNMWSVRGAFSDEHHAYLVQSFVGETRVLGVASSASAASPTGALSFEDDGGAGDAAMQGADDGGDEDDDDDAGGTLEEMMLPGLESSASTLYVGNVQEGEDRLLQITESQVRLFSQSSGQVVDCWNNGSITVATANEAGQVAIAIRGGLVVYFSVESDKIVQKAEKQMDREVSCLDLHPFASTAAGKDAATAMEIDGAAGGRIREANRGSLLAVGLWDDFTVRLLSLEKANQLDEALCINLGTEEEEDPEDTGGAGAGSQRRNRNNMMARSLCMLTLDFSSSGGGGSGNNCVPGVDMLFVGLGDGTLISFAVVKNEKISVRSKKEVCLGTQRIDLIPLTTERGGTCVLATGDRPTVIYLAGVAGSTGNHFNPKLCYSNVNLSASEDEEGDDVSRPPSQQAIAVNVATPFFSPLLFDVASLGTQHYSLCVADDSNLRLGVIDDIQKLHVTTCRLGMAPRRVVYCADGRLFAVGCIESGIKFFGLGDDEANMGNVIRFMDDTTFDDIERVDLEPYETILSMAYCTMKVTSSQCESEATDADGSNDASNFKPFLLVGTGYALPDEDEPTRGRILVYSFHAEEGMDSAAGGPRVVRQVTEYAVQGGVYSICQFYEGKILCSVNSKTMLCQLVDDTGFRRLQFVGIGHHGHILSLTVKSRAKPMLTDSLGRVGGAANSSIIDGQQPQTAAGGDSSTQEGVEKKPKEMLAIVGDMMRSISLVQYYPQHETLEEIARDFNSNWTTAMEMLTQDVYLGSENWNNLYCLRRNNSQSEEVRCRLDTIGEFHVGEMCNKFMRGSLVMPVSSSASTASDGKRGRQRRLASPGKKAASSSASSSPTARAAAAGGGTSAASRTRRPVVVTGSQTLFGTVDGTLGVVLGLDGRTAAFFTCLERAMEAAIKPVGNLSHQYFRACHTDKSIHPAYGFIDGDLVETFLDFDRATMDIIVEEMNRDGGWQLDDAIMRQNSDKKDGGGGSAGGGTGGDDRGGGADGDPDQDRSDLTVDDVLAMVEEMTMLH